MQRNITYPSPFQPGHVDFCDQPSRYLPAPQWRLRSHQPMNSLQPTPRSQYLQPEVHWTRESRGGNVSIQKQRRRKKMDKRSRMERNDEPQLCSWPAHVNDAGWVAFPNLRQSTRIEYAPAPSDLWPQMGFQESPPVTSESYWSKPTEWYEVDPALEIELPSEVTVKDAEIEEMKKTMDLVGA